MPKAAAAPRPGAASADSRPHVIQLCAVDFTVKHFLGALVRGLEGAGYRVTCVCSPGPFTQELSREGLTLAPVPIARSMNLARHAGSVYRLRRLFNQLRPDIVHVHTPVAALLGRLAASLSGVPLAFYTAHGFYFHDEMKPWLRAAHVALERLGGRLTDFLFTQSEEDRRAAVELGIVPADRALTILNGVDLARFSPDPQRRRAVRRELGIGEETPVVGMVGRVVREKGYGELFAAARLVRARIPQARFLVVGSPLASDRDPFAAEVERLLAGELKETVIVTGLQSDVPPYLDAMDVFTLPSYREGMPRTIIEAMGMGLPVVATDIRGCREEVVEGETGFLVPTRDAETLADRLLRLLADPELRRRCGQAGRERAHSLFDEKMVVDRQLEVYRRLLPPAA